MKKKAESVKQASVNLLQTLSEGNVVKRLLDWEEQNTKNAIFRSMMNYLHQVEVILHFVAASRNADLHLHLGAGETLSKLFFAMDRISKVNARQKFFLASPELSVLAKQFKDQFYITGDQRKEHQDLPQNMIKREHGTITKLKDAIMSHSIPFAVEGDRIYNVIMHAYVPDEYVLQILNIDITGQKLYEEYVSEWINGDVSILAPVRKENDKMYMSGNKICSVEVRDKVVDLKETKNLHGRLMVLAFSNREVDHKQAVGTS
ncbi:hypothetical protein SK128_012263 [Halocaridina rubra]|uniref:Uncharacterized protein n=1 Tax=Halocaridina rubra TaxID=373956 RepID=A0AAN9AGJ2_HALRR